ncbi:MAG: HNH endonuclease [Anaerolineaceae bacterium]
MPNEIIPYFEMCRRENIGNLQRGMNYRLNNAYSVILMSLRPNAPYADRIEDEGLTLIYEGHDISRTQLNPDPKIVDQPEFTLGNRLTDNGKFHKAAQEYKRGSRPAERVKVYEKIHSGIWSYNGLFELKDSWQEVSGIRKVFKFKLSAIGEEIEVGISLNELKQRQRIIPSSVKLEVWRRDGGKCVICGAKDELHFDHIIPYSKGGTSLSAENIQLLCARHNLEKRDKIE